MAYETLDLTIDGSTLIIKFNRPDVHNAMNDLMLKELIACFKEYKEVRDIRTVVITGKGKSFSAGADLNWMKSMVDYSLEENIKDSNLLLELYDSMYYFPKPLIAKINGHAFGGGVGFMAVCDVVVAVPDALFAFSEVNLGIIPSVISTYVIKRIGTANMKRLFITGERFDSQHGNKIGLIDIVVPPEELDAEIEKLIKFLNSSAPGAVKEVKELIRKYHDLSADEYKRFTVEKIAELRVSQEGQEGISAFLEKRKPKWREI
ncbi:MAG: enoyl-CoA hydratase-related protein [Thermoplasmata archaeon]